jgi:hypothetical protein
MKFQKYRDLRTSLVLPLGLSLCVLAGPSQAACLQKQIQSPNSPVPAFVVMIAPESAIAGYLKLGFSRIDCPSDLSVIRSYVAQICSPTGGGGMPVMNTDMTIGVPRLRACTDAQAGLAEAGG